MQINHLLHFYLPNGMLGVIDTIIGENIESMFSKIKYDHNLLDSRILNGDLHAPVEAIYDLDHLEDALRHAYSAGRNGKILFAPNG